MIMRRFSLPGDVERAWEYVLQVRVVISQVGLEFTASASLITVVYSKNAVMFKIRNFMSLRIE